MPSHHTLYLIIFNKKCVWRKYYRVLITLLFCCYLLVDVGRVLSSISSRWTHSVLRELAVLIEANRRSQHGKSFGGSLIIVNWNVKKSVLTQDVVEVWRLMKTMKIFCGTNVFGLPRNLCMSRFMFLKYREHNHCYPNRIMPGDQILSVYKRELRGIRINL